MLKIFLYKRIPALQDCFLINLFLSSESEFGPLFQKVDTAPFKKMVEIVEDWSDADYMMLPHNYNALEKKYTKYISEAEDFAARNKLITIISAYGDYHDDVPFQNSIILRTAKYKNTLKHNEIIVPPFIEDLGHQFGVHKLNKTKLPVIGFAGMVHFPTATREVKFQIKMMLAYVCEIVKVRCRYERLGLYFRRAAIASLDNCPVCVLRTQKRKTFSAAKSTIQGDPKIIRREFVDSIVNSHLALVVRGDGNYSLRFFEVLSLGRIPLFIDTDTPLPLEDEIDYDSFMLRVSYEDINKLPEIIDKFWRETSEERFIDMQKQARMVFETKLKPDRYYENLLSSFVALK